MAKPTDVVLELLLMEANPSVTGRTIKYMAPEFVLGRTAINTMVTTNTMKEMAKEFILGQTAINTMVTG